MIIKIYDKPVVKGWMKLKLNFWTITTHIMKLIIYKTRPTNVVYANDKLKKPELTIKLLFSAPIFTKVSPPTVQHK